MDFEVKNRWSGKVQFTAQIECSEHSSVGVRVGLAVRWAIARGAVLSGAVLSDAVLRGADLSDADLSDAVLRGAVLRGVGLDGVPAISNIHTAVYAAASLPDALDMDQWHAQCGTAHCRAGWVVTLAGDAGKALEWAIGTPAAAAVIYLKSDPSLERIPDFHCSNADALADMKRLADAEAAKAGA